MIDQRRPRRWFIRGYPVFAAGNSGLRNYQNN
jgi:hypothetical protein